MPEQAPSRYTETEAATTIQSAYRGHVQRKRQGAAQVESVSVQRSNDLNASQTSHPQDDARATSVVPTSPSAGRDDEDGGHLTKTQEFDRMLEEEARSQRGRGSSTSNRPARLGGTSSSSPSSTPTRTATTSSPHGTAPPLPGAAAGGGAVPGVHPGHSGAGSHVDSANTPPPPLPGDLTTSEEMEALVLWRMPELVNMPAAREVFDLAPKPPHVRFDGGSAGKSSSSAVATDGQQGQGRRSRPGSSTGHGRNGSASGHDGTTRATSGNAGHSSSSGATGNGPSASGLGVGATSAQQNLPTHTRLGAPSARGRRAAQHGEEVKRQETVVGEVAMRTGTRIARDGTTGERTGGDGGGGVYKPWKHTTEDAHSRSASPPRKGATATASSPGRKGRSPRGK